MGELLGITDYFVIVSGGSDRHVKTLAEEIEKELKGLGQKPVRREGEQASRWLLLDYVDVVAHVFSDEDREYYDLERLWGDAPRVAWNGDAEAAGS